jgi:molybdopterin biosynthesis enzyme MoaB
LFRQYFCREKEDKAGKAIISALEKNLVSIDDYIIIPDEIVEIQSKINFYVQNGISL